MSSLHYATAPRVRKGLPTGGEWTAQGHDDPGLVQVDDASVSEEVPALEDSAAEFEWTRIESLMGDDFHLDPDRTVSIPVMKADDDIAQMTRKVMTYVAKTQSVEGLTDEDVAAMVNMTTNPNATEMPDDLRRAFDVPAGERIVVCIAPDGRPIYLSTSSMFKQTGSFRNPRSGATYDIRNIAPQIVAATYQARFTEQHPEFDPKRVDQLFRRLAEKRYTGKGYKYMWDESLLPASETKVLAMTMIAAEFEQNPNINIDELTRRVARMSADDIREQLAKCEITVANAYDTERGFHDREAYTASLGRMRLTVGKEATDAHLTGETEHAKAALLHRAYRRFLEDELAIEYDYQRSRTYIRDANASHSATVFEQKKNVPATHVDAAEQGYFKTSGDFRHVELDEDTDLARLSQLEREYAQLRRHIPKTKSDPALRFRKTGRHHALGVYHPHADNIAVDPRHPSSFVHELVHHIDHTAGDRNISSGEKFRPLLRAAQDNLARSESRAVKAKLAYYQTPTEVLSKTAEAYFYWKYPNTSLNGDASKYEDDGAFRAIEPLRDQIIAFWDETLPAMGAEPIGDHAHRA